MKSLISEQVTHVHHWNEKLFSFRVSRQQGLRFENGHFTMIGLEVEGKPLMRAYSIASANYADELEFFSIKVPDGELTSRLQNIRVGDKILLRTKPTGTLIAGNLLPGGRHLYLLSTGTGLAPFMSIIQDPSIYEQYEKVVLIHGTRTVSELAYQDFIERELPDNEFFGELVREKLIYYPTVTREPYRNTGRITELMQSGKLFEDIGLPAPTQADDRFMICGSPAMLNDLCELLDGRGFDAATTRVQGHYAIERAFAESK